LSDDAEASQLDVSVVVCTRNRAGPLAELLESFTRIRVPDGLSWELLIVDNGSTDATPQVIEGYADRLPIRAVREETPGLANARNRGVASARGRYICWTDDDVEIDPEWLAAYAEAFRRFPDAAVFGGEIIPKLQPPTPRWFARLSHRWPLDNIVAARAFGDAIELDFERGVVPWGANYAVRTEEQRRHLYDPNLGVSPVQRRSGEETQAIFEALRAGARGRWTPASKVYHLFPPHRQSRRYFHQHFVGIGETQAYLDATHEIHYMNRDGRQPRDVRRSAGDLWLRMAFYGVLFAGFHAIGMTQRSLYYLRRHSIYSGVLAFKRRGQA
jgi:hypothetical protein